MRGEIRCWQWLVAIAIAALLQIGLLGAVFSSEPGKPKSEQPKVVFQLTAVDLPGSISVTPVAPSASATQENTQATNPPEATPKAPTLPAIPPKPVKAFEPARESGAKPPVKARSKPEPKRDRQPKVTPEVNVQAIDVPEVLQKPEALPAQAPTKPELAVPREGTAAQRTKQVIEPATAIGPLAAALPGPESAQLKTLYERQLLTWLAEHKRYPLLARHRGLEGVAEVTFKLDASGRVETSSLSASSGHSILDLAVMQLLERASPMPTPPDAIDPNLLMFKVPITFTLR